MVIGYCGKVPRNTAFAPDAIRPAGHRMKAWANHRCSDRNFIHI
jgi:hypothetical protein